MGCLSFVAIAISEGDCDKMYEDLSGEALDLLYVANATRITQKDNPWVILDWEDIKWYRSFKEVEDIEAFLQTVPHEFLCSGEECEGIEHNNTSGYDDVLLVHKKQVI